MAFGHSMTTKMYFDFKTKIENTTRNGPFVKDVTQNEGLVILD